MRGSCIFNNQFNHLPRSYLLEGKFVISTELDMDAF